MRTMVGSPGGRGVATPNTIWAYGGRTMAESDANETVKPYIECCEFINLIAIPVLNFARGSTTLIHILISPLQPPVKQRRPYHSLAWNASTPCQLPLDLTQSRFESIRDAKKKSRHITEFPRTLLLGRFDYAPVTPDRPSRCKA